MFVLLHVVALKDKLVAKWECNGLSFRQYIYNSCVVMLFFNNKVIHKIKRQNNATQRFILHINRNKHL